MSRPSTNGRADEGRGKSLAHLYGVIAEAVDAGRKVPCLGPEGALWTSSKTEEQQSAAYRCGGCPALDTCAGYVNEHGESSGVWGGRRCGK